MLRGVGIEVFLDVTSLRAGVDWPDTLEAAVDEADQVRLGWSRYAAQSNWVRREYQRALRKEGDALRIDILDDTPLPSELARIQTERAELSSHAIDNVLRSPTRSLPDEFLPTRLLRPEYVVAPFFGRETELAETMAWCREDPPFSATLFTSRGGSGKTRFAIELCRRLIDEGWDARFLDSERFRRALLAEARAPEALLDGRQDRVVVVDYAETRTTELRTLLRAGLDKNTGSKARLVFLARSRGDWWDQLLAASPDLAEAAGGRIIRRELDPVARTESDRGRILDQALEAFAAAMSRPRLARVSHDLADDRYREVLSLQVSALLTVFGEQLPAPETALGLVLDHEATYWQLREENPSYRRAFELSVGIVLLRGGAPAELDKIVDAVSGNRYVDALPRADQERLARRLIELYGHGDRVEPLQPDLLGECFVERELGRSMTLSTAWLVGASNQEIKNGLTVLDRAARDYPKAFEAITRSLKTDIHRLLFLAMAVATETGDPIGRILATALEADPRPDLAHAAEGQIPVQTTALREFAVAATRQALEHEALSSTTDDDRVSEASRLLNNLGTRLSELGRREEALEATRESADIRRKLAEARPDAFLPYLAGSLNNLGTRLSELGRREEALEATRESADIRRKLAEARPDAFLPDLAGSLNNLGNRLSELGRREEALEATRESVEHYRKLAEARPDAFLPDLARSLDNLGNRLSELGRREEALEATRESADIRRKLAGARPDAFLPDLAGSLNNLGNRLSELGRREEVLEATRESVTVLVPFTKQYLQRFGPMLVRIGHNYLSLCEELDREPDPELSQHVADTVGALSGDDQ